MKTKPLFVVTGPESTGKSTLCRRLGEQLGVDIVDEYARSYLQEHGPEYIEDDLRFICEGQYKDIDKMVQSAYSIVISDTDALTIKIWSMDRYGKVERGIVELLYRCPANHYFLCKDDIPWVEDPLREHPDSRGALFKIYEAEIKKLNIPFTIIEGSSSERLEKALFVIKNYKT